MEWPLSHQLYSKAACSWIISNNLRALISSKKAQSPQRCITWCTSLPNFFQYTSLATLQVSCCWGLFCYFSWPVIVPQTCISYEALAIWLRLNTLNCESSGEGKSGIAMPSASKTTLQSSRAWHKVWPISLPRFDWAFLAVASFKAKTRLASSRWTCLLCKDTAINFHKLDKQHDDS